MLPNWMTTVMTTKNTETLSNLLCVIYGNTQHHDVINHLVSRLDFTARLIAIVSNRSLFLRVAALPLFFFASSSKTRRLAAWVLLRIRSVVMPNCFT